MAQTDVRVNVDETRESSQRVVEDKNAAVFKPKWLVVDDINIDLISVLATITALIAVIIFRYPLKVAVPAAAAVILSLRAFLPLTTTPKAWF
jgi:hypothetical protein